MEVVILHLQLVRVSWAALCKVAYWLRSGQTPQCHGQRGFWGHSAGCATRVLSSCSDTVPGSGEGRACSESCADRMTSPSALGMWADTMQPKPWQVPVRWGLLPGASVITAGGRNMLGGPWSQEAGERCPARRPAPSPAGTTDAWLCEVHQLNKCLLLNEFCLLCSLY